MRYLALASRLAAGCVSSAKSASTTAPAPAAPQADFLRANLDTTVSPGGDFFQYANGGWLKRNPIPASESRWGIGNVVNDRLRTSRRPINEEAARRGGAPGSDQQKIGDFWTTAMDSMKAERLGVHPLDAQLAQIAAITNANDALDVAFALRPLGVNALFGMYVGQDERDSDVMAVHLYQSGLGLPERDFYFNTDTGVTRIRCEYVTHLEVKPGLLGECGTLDRATKVMAFETALPRPRASSRTFATLTRTTTR